MKRLLVLAITLAGPAVFNAGAMQKSAGEEGREMMKAVYDRFASVLNAGTFSEDELKAYNDFPTQSGREILTEGAKPGFISQGKKLQGLIDFFNIDNSKFAIKAVGILTALKEKLAKHADAVSSDELKQGIALATLINELFESMQNMRSLPVLVKKDALDSVRFFGVTFQNVIRERAEAPARQAAAEKKQREEQAFVQKLRDKRAAEERTKEESEAREAQRAIEVRQQALAALRTPAGQAVAAAMRAKAEAIGEKISAGTIDPVDIREIFDYYREGERPGVVSEQDYYIKRHTLVNFFNNNGANAQLIERLRELLEIPELTEAQNRRLFALKLLANELGESSIGTKTELLNAETVKQLRQAAERKARTVLQ